MIYDVSSSDEEDSVCSDVQRAAEEAISITAVTAIPEISRFAYEACYKTFCDWLVESKIKTVTEKVMLAYFMNKSKNKKSSTLYSEYSKLKCMIYLNQQVDIGKFANLIAFLKRKKDGYVPKKSKTFSKAEFNRFITEADNKEYLVMKVVLIIGVAGACRRDELLKLSTNDVVDSGECIRIDIQDKKTRMNKQFVLTSNSMGNANLIGILRYYMSLRKPAAYHDRFFVGYRSGKCTVQPVGINTIGGIPKKIAAFLGLDEVELYTGHCFRRSSAGILAESGVDFLVYKRDEVEGLRRMIPNYKQQNESTSTRTSSDGKLILKTEPNPTNERVSFGNVEFQHQDEDEEIDEEDAAKLQDSESEVKPQIFNIEYVVPSNLIMREHQPEQHTTTEPTENFPQSSRDISRTLISNQPINESDEDHHMQDDSDDVLPDTGNSYSLSTKVKIDNLRLQEMENRVKESRLRCEVQKLIFSKAEEEFRHLQEMNKLRLQEAKLRLKLLEQSRLNTGGNVDPSDSV